jgi:hypothetical protein
VKLIPELWVPPAASVRLTSPRLRRGSLCRIATSTLVRAGMSFVSQQEVLCNDDDPYRKMKSPPCRAGLSCNRNSLRAVR